ncbi:DUF1302 domain-containing protein [Burkholderia cepacia]|uniref:DUF1302 domain-containing protein n=1 Tax=Burkholderia cepacia TaxID=292 RepID=UPI002AB75D45|nr:DUF1302 domain-containing protein [Burkholderia cepacia]
MKDSTGSSSLSSNRREPTRLRISAVSSAVILLTVCHTANAFQFTTDDPDFSVRWDNTLKYSNAFRLKEASPLITSNENLDDGDRNFHRGLISNRFDILSELDASYKSFGGRVSVSAWYDTVYNHSNANNSPQTANAVSVPNNQFVGATRTLNGRDIQLLDAFVYKKGTIAEMPLTVRLGQHSVLYGETLFFGSNGIAGAQAPIDINKLLGVPNTQFKELVLPQPQISMQMQVKSNLSVGAYYQFSWQADRLPPVGSYFSNVDMLQQGGERILAGAPLMPGGGPAAFFHTGDQYGRNSGQGGLQVRWRPQQWETEFGFYAAQFNAKDPIIYVHPGVGVNPATGQIGTYQLVYPNDIKTIGASFTTSIGDTNFAGELSFRHNMPLVPQGGSVTITPGESADNGGNARYPVGNTMHVNLSSITTLPRTSFWQGGLLLAELAYNRRLNITANAQALDPNTTRGAAAVRVVFSPSYYQVLPGLDLNVPIGFGYTPFGRSSVLTGFNGGSYRGGDLSIGLAGVYLQQWNLSLNWTHYFGGANGVIGPANAVVQAYTFGQSYKDRDFIALSVSRSF